MSINSQIMLCPDSRKALKFHAPFIGAQHIHRHCVPLSHIHAPVAGASVQQRSGGDHIRLHAQAGHAGKLLHRLFGLPVPPQLADALGHVDTSLGWVDDTLHTET